MRTTVTLEKDVAARLERLRRTKPFKDVINEVLRAGLDAVEEAAVSRPRRYSIAPVKGKPRRTDLDNVAELLAEIEGDAFR